MVERGKNILPVIGFILIVIVVFGGFAFYGRIKDTNDHTVIDNSSRNRLLGYDIDSTGEIPTDGVDKITIRSVSSKVKIFTHNSDRVKAHFYGNVVGFNKDNIPYLEVEKNGNEALVRIVYPVKTGIKISEDTKLDVAIPDGWDRNIEINSISGDVTADQLTGNDVTLNTTSGNIKISEIKAKDNISASSVSGSCNIDKAISDYLKINTTSGSINIDFLEAREITIKTVSGDAKLTAAAEEAEINSTSGNFAVNFTNEVEKINAKSISGNVKLGLPGSAGFTADLKTVSGSINCEDFLMSISSSGKRELKGRVGSGEGEIDISTTSGDIKIYGIK
jgi:lia operon protein LiaG